jgi:hypothetical protein
VISPEFLADILTAGLTCCRKLRLLAVETHGFSGAGAGAADIRQARLANLIRLPRILGNVDSERMIRERFPSPDASCK